MAQRRNRTLSRYLTGKLGRFTARNLLLNPAADPGIDGNPNSLQAWSHQSFSFESVNFCCLPCLTQPQC